MVGGLYVLKFMFLILENVVSVVLMWLFVGGVGGVGDCQVFGQFGWWVGGVVVYLYVDGGVIWQGSVYCVEVLVQYYLDQLVDFGYLFDF